MVDMVAVVYVSSLFTIEAWNDNDDEVAMVAMVAVAAVVVVVRLLRWH